MAFNREEGEKLDGLETLHVVIDARALALMDNLRTPYSVKSKFRTVAKHRPVFDDAVAHAVEAFAEAGALRPIRFDEDDVLVQVYPNEQTVAVVFQRKIAGKVHYVTRTYPVPPPVLDDLLRTVKPPRMVS